MLELRKILEHSQIFAKFRKNQGKNVFSIGLAFAGFEPDQF